MSKFYNIGSGEAKIIGTKDPEGLRKVEKDVIIPKKIRAKAMVLCSDLVKEFEDCIRGRTVSMVWKCREQNNKMKECLAKHFHDEELYEECKQEYLKERELFRTTGVRSKKMQRAGS